MIKKRNLVGTILIVIILIFSLLMPVSASLSDGKYDKNYRYYTSGEIDVMFSSYRHIGYYELGYQNFALDNYVCLSIALERNEIYARHGKIFNTKDFQKFYQKQDWYVANKNYKDSLLNKFERVNANTFLKMEKQFGCTKCWKYWK